MGEKKRGGMRWVFVMMMDGKSLCEYGETRTEMKTSAYSEAE